MKSTLRQLRYRLALVLPLPALVAAGLAGCATQAPPVNVSAPGFGDNATGVVQFWDRSTTSPFGQLLVNKFNATHKNLKVVLTPVQDTQYVTKLATADLGQRTGP